MLRIILRHTHNALLFACILLLLCSFERLCRYDFAQIATQTSTAQSPEGLLEGLQVDHFVFWNGIPAWEASHNHKAWHQKGLVRFVLSKIGRTSPVRFRQALMEPPTKSSHAKTSIPMDVDQPIIIEEEDLSSLHKPETNPAATSSANHDSQTTSGPSSTDSILSVSKKGSSSPSASKAASTTETTTTSKKSQHHNQPTAQHKTKHDKKSNLRKSKAMSSPAPKTNHTSVTARETNSHTPTRHPRIGLVIHVSTCDSEIIAKAEAYWKSQLSKMNQPFIFHVLLDSTVEDACLAQLANTYVSTAKTATNVVRHVSKNDTLVHILQDCRNQPDLLRDWGVDELLYQDATTQSTSSTMMKHFQHPSLTPSDSVFLCVDDQESKPSGCRDDDSVRECTSYRYAQGGTKKISHSRNKALQQSKRQLPTDFEYAVA